MENSWHSAFELVPHRPPMLLVDKVRLAPSFESDAESEHYDGEALAVINADWPLLTSDGTLLGPAFFEISAQSFAALAGLKIRFLGDASKPRIGFLVSVKRFAVHGKARVGDRLNIQVRTVAALGEFVVIESEIFCGEEKLAGGQLKIFVPTPEQVKAMLEADSADK